MPLKSTNAFSNKFFRIYFIGTFFGQNAYRLGVVTQMILIWKLAGTELSLGIGAASLALPMIAFNLFGGILADRYESRILLLVVSSLGIISFTCVSFLDFFDYVEFWHIIIFSIFINIKIEYPFLLIVYVILCSFILGAAGICAGLWADKFDNMATITNFVIVPLSFLSGTFYSVSELPSILKTLSYYNPFFYMIDGFRFAFIGQSDGSIKIGLCYLIILAIMVWLISYLLYKKGYKIKS